MTSYCAYTFYIDTNGSNSEKDIIEKLMKHGDLMIFENKKLNKMRIWLYNDDEALLKIKYYTHLKKSSKNMQLMHS